ncbi:MAG: hypothetical protein ABDH28_00210 [Brevinematia bacterium]
MVSRGVKAFLALLTSFIMLSCTGIAILPPAPQSLYYKENSPNIGISSSLFPMHAFGEGHIWLNKENLEQIGVLIGYAPTFLYNFDEPRTYYKDLPPDLSLGIAYSDNKTLSLFYRKWNTTDEGWAIGNFGIETMVINRFISITNGEQRNIYLTFFGPNLIGSVGYFDETVSLGFSPRVGAGFIASDIGGGAYILLGIGLSAHLNITSFLSIGLGVNFAGSIGSVEGIAGNIGKSAPLLAIYLNFRP